MRSDDTSRNNDAPQQTDQKKGGRDAMHEVDANGAPSRTQPPLVRDGVNWIGLETLIRREITRFLKVYGQTVLAHVATSALFLAVFAT